MGCDIHLCLERRRKQAETIHNELTLADGTKRECNQTLDQKWKSCFISYGRPVNPGRIYGMFAKLADVRNYWDIVPIESRGFPEDANSNTLGHFAHRIVPDEEYKEYMAEWDDSPVKQTEADRWVKDYGCKIVEYQNEWNKDIVTKYVTDPDMHSPNWCSADELDHAIKEIFKDENRDYYGDRADWEGLLGMMRGYEENGVWETRCVFWFDN